MKPLIATIERRMGFTICILLLLSLLPLACDFSSEEQPKDPASYGQCTDDDDCRQDSYCHLDETGISGVCVIDYNICHSSDDCENNELCDPDTRHCRPIEVEGCEEGQVMVAGECINPECTADAHCSDGYYCNLDVYLCELKEPSHCRDNSDCDQPFVCKRERCTFCSDNDDCEITETCKSTATNERACVAISCRQNSECREGYWCKEETGVCRPPCTRNEECENGKVCHNGLCEMINPECETDWDCPRNEVCKPYFLCERGDDCQLDGECGAGRVCNNDIASCIPEGCYFHEDCDNDKACDPGAHECRYASPTGGSCGYSGQCFTIDVCYRSTCIRTCDPYHPNCQSPYICELVLDSEEGLASLCLPPTPGQGLGEYCDGGNPCRNTLVCERRECGSICNPETGTDICPNDKECIVSSTYDVGVCQTPPCDPVSNPCPYGTYCINGRCANCSRNEDCPPMHRCTNGQCEPGCWITGCPVENTSCNSRTGRCEEQCYPACEEGSICENHVCVPLVCNPPCEPPSTCEYGECIYPSDCRYFGCPDERWICDLETGLCEEPPCPPCPPGQCCSELTDYQCSPHCYTCSEEFPQGSCPPGRICDDGYCRHIPCVDETMACGAVADPPGAPCCEGLVCCEVFPGSGGKCCLQCDFDGSCVTEQ